MLTTIKVLELPPSDDCNKYVNLEFLYGMCFSLLYRASMTLPKVDRLLFMLLVSVSLSFALVFALSEPARSTRLIEPTYLVDLGDGVRPGAVLVEVGGRDCSVLVSGRHPGLQFARGGYGLYDQIGHGGALPFVVAYLEVLPGVFVLQFREMVYLTEMHKITILQMIGYGDRTWTQAEVVRLIQEKYPELPPISQSTVTKIEKQFWERGHVRQLKKNPPNKLSDDQKLDVVLMLGRKSTYVELPNSFSIKY
ncbi:hypothetical protein NQ318_004777 [Aromia moschata]|uniref:Sperm-lysin n=1 Tax=Aromia moschata TaxID=1265417 RepID=A0AAV8XTW4_9CUCU|nr:hypothetical protein NQ318_004777 [Aromia moschata]